MRRGVVYSLPAAKLILTPSCLIAPSPSPSLMIGKFLSIKDEDVEPVEHAERFFLWLDHIGSAPGTS